MMKSKLTFLLLLFCLTGFSQEFQLPELDHELLGKEYQKSGYAEDLIYIYLHTTFDSLEKKKEVIHYVVKQDGDTVTLELTALEQKSLDKETSLFLRHNSKKKKKKIKENSSGDTKFHHNDSTYWIGFTKFYDQYFIALIARKKQVKKSKYELYNPEYRRIYYSEVMYIHTAGRTKFFWPRSIVGFTAMTGGFGFAIGAIGGNPALIPVGLAISVLGYIILNPLIAKDYYLKDWSLEVL